MIRERQSPQQEEQRSPLYLLTGVVAGFLLGLALTWAIFPARTAGSSPAELPGLQKETYRVQIAMAYAASGDANRAAARLNLLGDRDPIRELNVQAQLALLSQDTQREARALSQLSQAIYGLVVARLAEEEGGGIQLAGEAGYQILELQRICEDASAPPLLRLYLLDGEGQPQEGMRLVLRSDAGDEETYTGLRPENGPGFGQFDLFPQESYALNVDETESLTDIHAPQCEGEEGESYWGSLLITLQAE